MSFRNPRLSSLVLCAVLLAAPAGHAVNSGTNTAAKPADKITELFGDPLVAKGTGVEVKRSQLDAAMITVRSAAAARGNPLPPGESQMLEKRLLQRMIQIQLLLNKATDADRAKAKESSVKRLEGILKQAGSEEALNRQLKAVGMSREELETQIGNEAIAEEVVEREVMVDVTDEDVKKHYDENPARFEAPEQVRASHILLSTRDPETRQPLSDEKKAAKRKQADELVKRARAGEDFAKLAKEFSEDPGSKDKGGEYIFGRGEMVPEFESAAFSLGTNQVSDVVTTSYGFHIVKLSEKLPARKIEFEKIKERLKQELKGRALSKVLPEYIEKLSKESKVEILDEKLKPSENDDLPGPARAPQETK